MRTCRALLSCLRIFASSGSSERGCLRGRILEAPTPHLGNAGPFAASSTHASLAAGLEEYFGLCPLLGGAATATPLPIPGGATPPPAPSITGFSPSSGIPEDLVTITGTNFTNACAVRFNSTPATFTLTGDTTITATVPSGARTGRISVTTAVGTAISTSDYALPPPSPPSLLQHVLAKGNCSAPTNIWPQPTTSGDLLVAAIG